MIRETKPTHLTLRLSNKETTKLSSAIQKKGVTKSQLMRVALNNYFTQNNIVAETATKPN
jgi:hypothetical protein